MTDPGHPSAVTIGLHIVDILGRPVESIPPGQGVALIDEIRMTVAGTAAGTAIDLAKLGIDVATFGVVGNDELGVWLRSKMDKVGIDVRGLAIAEEYPTSATLLPIRPNGDRPALHVLGANAALSPAHLDMGVISRARVLHVGGACLLPGLDGEPTARLLEQAQAAGVITTMDLIGMPDADHEAIFGPCYPHLDYFLPNDEDALMLSGAPTLPEAIAWLHERGVGTTVVSLGEDGACLSASPTEHHVVPAFEVDVVDTTGCGDAFSAGFITGLIEGMEPLAATELGVAAGSMVATGLGSDAGISTRRSVDDFTSRTPRRSSAHAGLGGAAFSS